MLFIPTHVALATDDPELVRAHAVVRARLRAVAEGDRTAPKEGEYLASAPYRNDDGTIAYVHVFRVDLCGRVHSVGIPADAGWWPSAKHSLAPRRTPRRARLRLVS